MKYLKVVLFLFALAVLLILVFSNCDISGSLVYEAPDNLNVTDTSSSNIQLYNMSATVSSVIATKSIRTYGLSALASYFNSYKGNGSELYDYNTGSSCKIQIYSRDWILGENSAYGKYLCNALGIPWAAYYKSGMYAYNCTNTYYSTLYNWYKSYENANNYVLDTSYEYGSDEEVDFNYYIDNSNEPSTLSSVLLSTTSSSHSLPQRGYANTGGNNWETAGTKYRSVTLYTYVTKHRTVEAYKRVRDVSFELAPECRVSAVRTNANLVYQYIIEDSKFYAVLKEDVLPQSGIVCEIDLSMNGETATRIIQIQD